MSRNPIDLDKGEHNVVRNPPKNSSREDKLELQQLPEEGTDKFVKLPDFRTLACQTLGEDRERSFYFEWQIRDQKGSSAQYKRWNTLVLESNAPWSPRIRAYIIMASGH